MIELLRVADDLQNFCLSHDWKFCFIGGLANLEWGRLRLTNDVDLSLLTGFGGEEIFVDTLLERYRPRRADARAFALANRVLLARSAEGLPIDIALAALPFEARVVERGAPRELTPGVNLRLCSAEDLVILKCFAAREQDWIDVEGVIIRRKGEFDRALVRRELRELCALKEEPEIMTRLEGILRRHAG